MKTNILKDTLLIFLGSTVAFLFVPLFMVGNSPEEYSFLDWEIFYKTSIFFIIIVGTFFSFTFKGRSFTPDLTRLFISGGTPIGFNMPS